LVSTPLAGIDESLLFGDTTGKPGSRSMAASVVILELTDLQGTAVENDS
jgi:hypothetical protein